MNTYAPVKFELISENLLALGYAQCDCCGQIEDYPQDLFWNTEPDFVYSEKQLKVIDFMQKYGLDAICEKCFYSI